MEQQSYLSNIEFNPVLASTGKRFLNYLVDFIISYILMIIVFVVIFLNNRSVILSETVGSMLLTQLLAITIFVSYYTTCEMAFKGRTVGKLITGTKAVNEDGTEPEARTYFLRSLSRIVPFEVFSAFGGQPWHDKWTKTYVIDVKKSTLNNPSFYHNF